MSDNLLRDAAEQEAPNATDALVADDDQVGVDALGEVKDRLGGIAAFSSIDNNAFDSVRAQPLGGCVGDFNRGIGNPLATTETFFGTHRAGVRRQNVHRGAEGTRQLTRLVDGDRRG